MKSVLALKKIFNIKTLKSIPKHVLAFVTFFILLQIFVTREFVAFLGNLKGIGPLLRKLVPLGFVHKINQSLDKIINKIEAIRTFKVKRYYLINLAFNNLKIKKSRSLITVFGMSVGVGIIVYLLSLGYGIERMVISKVARLEELKMADVLPGETGDVKINQKLITKIKNIKHVEQALPMVSVVGKVNYRNAKTDILVYAVTDDYLTTIGSKILKGEFFSDRGQFLSYVPGLVKGESTQLFKATIGSLVTKGTILFNIKPNNIVTVWNECSLDGQILGYTKRIEGGLIGQEYWGGEYAPYYSSGRVAYDSVHDLYLGKWLKTKAPLYDKLPENMLRPKLDDNGRQLWEEVCLQEKGAMIQDTLDFAEVLGESTESASVATESAVTQLDVTVVASGEGGLELVSLNSSASAGITSDSQRTETIKFQGRPLAKAVISSGMANFLAIPINKGVNDRFKVSFIVMRNLVSNQSGKLTTEEVQYEIMGIIDDDTAEYFYIPLSDVQKLGLRNYSQLKVVITDKKYLKEARQDIEELGVTTSSTADTVAQIEGLFINIRLLLGLLGTIALGVAALGMFNTLTVSLLERTREIGGMKTMGMVSEEIQELFLSEAMIMGFAGGMGGLFLGYLAGESTSFFISLIAIARGVGYLHLSYVPLFLILFILVSSFFVGVVTGLYPAQRAKKTSALNALRYE